MKKFSKAAMPAVLASAMIITALPTAAFASEADTDSDSYQITSSAVEAAIEAYENNVDPYGSKSDDNLDTLNDPGYPKVYDLTDGHIMKALGIEISDENIKNVISSVKLQSPYGTCWGFAATAAAEGSIVGELKAKDNTIDPNDNAYNFSEKYLAWFAENYLDAEASGHTEYASQDGEGRHWADSISDSNKYNLGGTMTQATALYASGLGPVLEYSKNDDGTWEDCVYTYKGLKGKIQYRTNYLEDLTWYCYSASDDWSIDESERFHQKYQLQESYLLQSPAGKNSDGSYYYNLGGIYAIQRQLLQNRPVSIGFYADTSTPNDEGEAKYINTKNWAHYTYVNTEEANHGVTIVGWDDDYPASNFNSEHQPPGNGAFLVKNSWGSGENEFPNRGSGEWGIEVDGKNTGYFWISYYDQSICSLEALDFDTQNTAWDEYILNQYDFMPSDGALCYAAKSGGQNETAKLANVFTANEGGEKIFAMSCQTGTPWTTVTYEVVLLSEDSENPEDGYVIYTTSESYEYGGYHRYEIPKESQVAIPEGGKYAIVCTLEEPDSSNDIYINYATGKKTEDDATWIEGVINPGESYLYTASDGWKDLSEVSKQLKNAYHYIYGQEKEFDNFAIKAYASPIKDNDMEISLSNTNILRYLDTTDDNGTILSASVIGTTDTRGDDYKLSWRTSNEKVVQINQASGLNCDIEFVGYGTANIICYCPKIGYAICHIEVSKIPIENQSISLSFTKATYTGKALTPSVKITDGTGKEIDTSNYTVSYSNNKNAGTATVKITAAENSIYTGTALQTFTIIKATQKITNYKNITKTYKANKKTKKLAKKKTFKLSAKSSAGAKVTYKKVSGNKKITVSSSGKVTVKKGLKKGTYKVKVKAAAKATTNYNASKAVTKTITIKVK